MHLGTEDIVRTLFAARSRLVSSIWIVTRQSDAAEDIFQDVSVKAIGNPSAFESEAHLLSWAMVVARRQAIDWMRRKHPRQIPLDDDVLELLSAAASDKPSAAGRLGALQECMAHVPAEGRRLVDLRYGEGRSCEEVATAIGIGVDAVYQRLSRLHKALKECVERRLQGEIAINRVS